MAAFLASSETIKVQASLDGAYHETNNGEPMMFPNHLCYAIFGDNAAFLEHAMLDPFTNGEDLVKDGKPIRVQRLAPRTTADNPKTVNPGAAQRGPRSDGIPHGHPGHQGASPSSHRSHRRTQSQRYWTLFDVIVMPHTLISSCHHMVPGYREWNGSVGNMYAAGSDFRIMPEV